MKELKLTHEKKISPLKKVIILIDSAYKWGRGWTEEEKSEFEGAIFPRLKNVGFKIVEPEWSASCPTIEDDDGTYLYLHPMEFTGHMSQDNIDKVIDVLGDVGKVADVRKVITETVERLTDEEYVNILKENSENIIEWLKSNSLNDGFKFAEKYRIKRDVDGSGFSSSDTDVKFVEELRRSILD